MNIQPIRIVVLCSCFVIQSINLIAGSDAASPNIVIIYVDDLNFKDVDVYSESTLTPNMDRLAESGMIFNQGYVTSAMCTPSRYSLLSGKLASRSNQVIRTAKGDTPNVEFNAKFNKTENWTIATYLKSVGYRTGFIGKWHLGTYQKNVFNADDLLTEDVVSLLKENNDILDDFIGSKGFDYVKSAYAKNLDHPGYLPKKLHFHNMEYLTSSALDFINVADEKSEPFFMMFSTTLVHGPNQQSSLEQGDYITPIGLNVDWSDDGLVQKSRKSVIERAVDNEESGYLTWLDDGIGSIIDLLEEKGIEENTVVFFISDNQLIGKWSCYQGGAHVPFFVTWPSVVDPGSSSDRLVANIDVTATILEIVGGGQYLDSINGKSFLSGLKKESERELRDEVLLEACYSRALVNGDWKYVTTRFPNELQEQADDGVLLNHRGQLAEDFSAPNGLNNTYPGYFDYDQLYNLKTDPNEQNNLYSKNNSLIGFLVNYFKFTLVEKLEGLEYQFQEYTKNSYVFEREVVDYDDFPKELFGVIPRFYSSDTIVDNGVKTINVKEMSLKKCQSTKLLGLDTTLLIGQCIELKLPNTGLQYRWNTGEDTNSIVVYEKGQYIGMMISKEGCIMSDTINVAFLDGCTNQLKPEIKFDKDTLEGGLLSLNYASPVFTYYWNTGEVEKPIENPIDGKYIVTVIDKGNCISYDSINIESKIVSEFEDNPVELGYAVFPNPFDDIVTLNFKDDLSGMDVQLFDINGKQVAVPINRVHCHEYEIMTKNLKPGIYILICYRGRGLFFMSKLFK